MLLQSIPIPIPILIPNTNTNTKILILIIKHKKKHHHLIDLYFADTFLVIKILVTICNNNNNNNNNNKEEKYISGTKEVLYLVRPTTPDVQQEEIEK